jgi:2-polyprenyl-6-methoxyphenol hydroxylase-like FAD-dependent oxidoreductase
MSKEEKAHTGGSHAVVIGGSMAGLLAARVLSDRFERVTMVERDRFPDGTENRKGVPQARHAHALLPRGFMIMARLFPGIAEELVSDGAIASDVPAESLRWWMRAGVVRALLRGCGRWATSVQKRRGSR